MARAERIELSLAVLETAALPLSYAPIIYKLFDSGAQGQDRTADTRFFKPVLYHLSYLRILSFSRRQPSTHDCGGRRRSKLMRDNIVIAALTLSWVLP
jgi:hypothetical protein